MWLSLNTAFIRRFSLLLALSVLGNVYSTGQNLFPFIDDCKNCIGKVKRVKTKQKADFKDYQSPIIYQTDEYNTDDQLIKTEISINQLLSKTIHYGYKDSLLIYEHHISPEEDEFFFGLSVLSKRNTDNNSQSK